MSTLTIGTAIGNGRLLDTIGRRAPESEALWKHAKNDRGATLDSGIGEPWVGADWGDGGGREGKVSEEWVGKAAVLGRVLEKRSSALACYLAVSAFSTASGFLSITVR